VFLLPIWTYLAFRLMGFRFPGPLLGAATALVFLFLEDNPIWGGTIASTLAGEFAYMYGLGLAVLFLGVVYRAYARGHQPWGAGVVLAVTAFAHGYAVLWAGLSATYFLYAARRPARTFGWLAAVGLLAFAIAGISLVPLLGDWGWTTPYDDPWITVELPNLMPSLLRPWLVLVVLGFAGTWLLARRLGGPDHRILFLLHAALIGAALAAAGPALGVIDVRFVPFAQLATCLAGGAALGLVVSQLVAADVAALGLVLLAAVYAEGRSTLARSWIEWNYTGLEAKEQWPAFKEMTERLQGTVADPRVAVEYNALHEKAGSIRMYETLPFFTGRSTLEGVYNQASPQTHFVYYLASELGETSPNPFRSRDYSTFDTENALRHLRLFNVSDVVALSPKLIASLEARGDVDATWRVPPYALFHLRDGEGGYVEPMRFAPVRSPRKGWRDRAYRWFSQKPLSPAHLVFTEDPRFTTIDPDPWLPPPKVPLDPGVTVRERVEAERITIETSRVGHPLLVKVSYHPRWRAEGAYGPFLVSPALMMVIPRQPTVHLVYSRTAADWFGAGLSLGAVALVGILALRRRVAPVPSPSPALDPCAAPAPPRRWGASVPIALVALLAAGRFVGTRTASEPAVAATLYERASRAYTEQRYADAAEYVRSALVQGAPPELKPELLCVRGESLLRAERPREAAEAFEMVTRDFPGSPHEAQALFGAVQAREAAGEGEAAAPMRKRLLAEFGDTPWASRLAGRAP
jgi:hypothetical protein